MKDNYKNYFVIQSLWLGKREISIYQESFFCDYQLEMLGEFPNYQILHKKHKEVFEAWNSGKTVLAGDKEYCKNYPDFTIEDMSFLEEYDENIEYSIKKGNNMDLTKCWCKATEENFNALSKAGCSYNKEVEENYKNKDALYVNEDNIIFCCDSFFVPYSYSFIKLVDGELQHHFQNNGSRDTIGIGEKTLEEWAIDKFLEEEQCSFEKHGFEKPEFKGEILKKIK